MGQGGGGLCNSVFSFFLKPCLVSKAAGPWGPSEKDSARVKLHGPVGDVLAAD